MDGFRFREVCPHLDIIRTAKERNAGTGPAQRDGQIGPPKDRRVAASISNAFAQLATAVASITR